MASRTAVASGLVGAILLASCGGSSPEGRPAMEPDETRVTTAATGTAEPTPSSTEPSDEDDESTTSTSTTVAPTAPPSTEPTATSAPDATVTEWPDADGVPLVPDSGDCAPTWTGLARPDGELTFVRDGAVLTVDPTTGGTVCLATIERDPTRLDWNPAGDRLLVDSDLLLTEDGIEPSGFEPGRTDVAWSQPTGTSLIAPSADGSALRHVDTRSGTEIDIASLPTTWAAAYHPSGTAVVAAGIDEAGQRGLFLADNRGDQRTMLVFLEDPATTITDVEFAPDGSAVYFVHDHTAGTTEPGVMGHVHRFELVPALLTDLAAEPDVVPFDLHVSERADGTVTWRRDRSTAASSLDVWRSGEIDDRRVSEWKIDVVGTIDDGTLAVLLRPVAGDGPGNLWLLPPDDDPILVARGVSAATTRAERSMDWSEPPLSIEQRAVG